MPTGMRDYDRWDGSEQTFLDTDDFSIVCIPNYISHQRFFYFHYKTFYFGNF